METIVPLISSDTKGPLGVKHLPRLWLKTLLKARGRLPEGYYDIRPGFDYMVLEGLGIDPDRAREYIFDRLPDYLQFENWIRSQAGGDLSEENIARINRMIEEKQKAPDLRQAVLETLGLPLNFPAEDSVMINNLDDWHAFHRSVTG